MAVRGHTFPADIEETGSSSWVYVLYFWDEQISYSNSGVLLNVLNMTYVLQNELTTWMNC